MIEKFTEGQAKDEILKYCIGQKRGNIASTELQNELFPNTSVDVVNILLQKIKDESNGIANINLKYRTRYISTNGAAQMFLDQGGFEKLESDSNSASDFSKEKGILELNILKHQNEIKDKELKIIDLTAKNLRLQNKQMKRAVLYSIIGFLAGAIITNLKDILILLNIMTPE